MLNVNHFEIAEIDTGDGMLQEAFTAFGGETAHVEIALRIPPEERKLIAETIGLPDADDNIWLQLYDDNTAYFAVPSPMQQVQPHVVKLKEEDAKVFLRFAQEHVYGFDGMQAKVQAFNNSLPLHHLKAPKRASVETGKHIWTNQENCDEPANVEFLLWLPPKDFVGLIARTDIMLLGKAYELHGTCTADGHASLILQHHSEYGVFKHVVPLKKSEEKALLAFAEKEVKGFTELRKELAEPKPEQKSTVGVYTILCQMNAVMHEADYQEGNNTGACAVASAVKVQKPGAEPEVQISGTCLLKVKAQDENNAINAAKEAFDKTDFGKLRYIERETFSIVYMKPEPDKKAKKQEEITR